MKRTNSRTHPVWSVHRTFESTRLSPVCLTEAYAVLVPAIRRRVAVGRPSTADPAASTLRRAGGALR